MLLLTRREDINILKKFLMQKNVLIGVCALVFLVGAVLLIRSGANQQSKEQKIPSFDLPSDLAKSEDAALRQEIETKKNSKQQPQKLSQKNRMHTITLQTSKGDITFQTYDTDAPKTVENFVSLAQKGYYDNLIFHRVIKGFMIQGGDPKGDGTGGHGYTFEDELDSATKSYKQGYKKGVVAMANAGPNTNGSQFFIMLEDYPLPNNYTIFGHVIKGQEVVDSIGVTPTDSSDRPKESVIIKSVTVEAQ